MEVRSLGDPEELSRAASEGFIDLAWEAIAQADVFNVALSGGRTPHLLYKTLARSSLTRALPWEKCHFFWGDERCVAPDHPDSNFALAHRALLARIHIPNQNVHPMPGRTQPIEHAAEQYENHLKQYFGSNPPGGFPVFDLILLGLGEDGHTASLFPHDPALTQNTCWVAAVHPPPKAQPAIPRLTLTLPVINAAHNVIFLVSGPGKRRVLNRVLYHPDQASESLPAALVKPAGRLRWYVDQAASTDEYP
jgi:6-phosphogluconolactonase